MSGLSQLQDLAGKSDVDDMTLLGLLNQFLITSVGGVVATLFFSYMLPRNKKVYQPNKVYSDTVSRQASIPYLNTGAVPRHLPDLPKTLFGWVPVVIRTSEKQLMNSLGLDAVMFVKLTSTLLKCFTATMFMSILLLLLNFLAPRYGPYAVSLLPWGQVRTYNTTLAISYAPDFLWGHTVVAYMTTAIFLYMFNKMWLDYIRLRQEYFRSFDYHSSPYARTVLATNLKSSMLESDIALAKAMIEVNVNHFSSARLGKRVDALQELVEKRERSIFKLEKIMQAHFKGRLSLYDSNSETVDKLPNAILPPKAQPVLDKIKFYEEKIYLMRKGGALEFKTLYAGFIEFETPEEAHDVVKQLHGRALDLKIEPAPEPSDIIWPNLGIEPRIIQRKKWAGNLLTFLIVIGWIIPLYLLIPFAQPSALIRVFPSLGDFFTNYPRVKELIQSMMVPTLFNIIIMIMPPLFHFISLSQGVYTQPALTKATFRKLFLFYTVGYFTFYTLVSVFIIMFSSQNIAEFKEALNDTDSGSSARKVLNKVGQEIMKIGIAFAIKGQFWINYITNNSAGSIPIDLARFSPLIVAFIKRKFFTLTPREYIGITTPPGFQYDLVSTGLLYHAFLALIYAWVQPLISIAVFLYFVIASIVYKYQIMYIFTTPSQAGGTLFPTIYKRIIAILLSAQGLFILYLLSASNLQVYVPAILIGVLFLITAGVGYKIYKTHIKSSLYIHTNSTTSSTPYGVLDDSTTDVDVQRDKDDRKARRRYMHPALVSNLIVPMVDPRVQYVLEPHFPELVEGYQKRRGSEESVNTMFSGYSGQSQKPLISANIGDDATYYRHAPQGPLSPLVLGYPDNPMSPHTRSSHNTSDPLSTISSNQFNSMIRPQPSYHHEHLGLPPQLSQRHISTDKTHHEPISPSMHMNNTSRHHPSTLSAQNSFTTATWQQPEPALLQEHELDEFDSVTPQVNQFYKVRTNRDY